MTDRALTDISTEASPWNLLRYFSYVMAFAFRTASVNKS